MEEQFKLSPKKEQDMVGAPVHAEPDPWGVQPTAPQTLGS
jgi:hypothetical protein